MSRKPPLGSAVRHSEGDLRHFLGRATVQSERLRAAVLGALALVGLLLAAVLPGLVTSRQLPIPQLGSGLRGSPAMALTAALAAVELSMYLVATRRSAQGRDLPRGLSLFGVTVEISILTLALAFGATTEGVQALATPLVLAYFILIGLTVLRLRPGLPLVAGVLAGVEYVALAVIVLSRGPEPTGVAPQQLVPLYYITRATLMALMGVASSFVAWELRRSLSATWSQLDERRRVQRVFGEHLHPAVVDELLRADGLVEGERRHVVVMFLDLRGYTSFAQDRDPREVVSFLNRFFGISIPVVVEAGGVVHQLLGDGFMAIFGAPIGHDDDERRAVQAAMDIRDAVRSEVRVAGLHPFDISVGIHAGEVVAGSVGSPSHREYTVTGDVVNTASRIEVATRTLGGTILVSADVLRPVREAQPELEAVSRGDVTLRGRDTSLELFAIQ